MILTDGLLVSNELVAFLGFITLVTLMSGFGYSRVTQATGFHDVFKTMLEVGGAGIAVIAVWLTLTLNPFSGIPLAVLLGIWVLVFGGMTRWSARWSR
jgi:hypothetical protein